MLYGLPTRQSGPLADKNRYAPWTGEAMQGRMDLDAGGQLWTVLRGTRRVGAPMGGFSCTYTGTSQPVPDITGQNLAEPCWASPGGIPAQRLHRAKRSGRDPGPGAGTPHHLPAVHGSGGCILFRKL